SRRNNDIDLQPDELGREFCVALIAALYPAILNHEVATVDPSEFAEPLHERGNPFALERRRRAQESDDRQLARLLRPRGERPGHRRAADERDEPPPSHYSITSSAPASRLSGTTRPSAFAVLRLMTSSYLVGACTGRSAGFSPLRMRSIYPAARRY